jgi:methionyl-tRNA formyltransferase
MSDPVFIVATIKPWNVDAFHQFSPKISGEWHLITDKKQLVIETLRGLKPKYIFFPHWSWIVPAEILTEFDCVCFHMTPLPYGRGGSPLQNMIRRGHRDTLITALRMTSQLDAGPIYIQRPLSLEGSAQEIFERFAIEAWDIIRVMTDTEIVPKEQSGSVEVFQRLTPEESLLDPAWGARKTFDHIRMLDAETYPKAFLPYGEGRLEFSQARIDDDKVTAKVEFVWSIK